MLELAVGETMGTITALMPPEAIATMRATIGPQKWICAQQVVMLETDAARARAAARKFLHFYLGSPTYHTHLRALGFTDADLAGGGSDRFLDAMVAWGDEDAIRARVKQHWDAGADHVCIQPISPSDVRDAAGERVLDLLAPAPRS